MERPELSAISRASTRHDVTARAFDLGRLEERMAMVRARLPEPDHKPKPASFTAAAQIVDLSSPREQARVRRTMATRSGAWQTEAWGYYDSLPEVKSGARFKARSLSKLRLYPAVIVDPDSDPVSLDTPIDDNDTPVIEDQALVAACNDAILRLGSGKGGIPSILERWGGNGFVVGEGYLIGYADPENRVTGETFGFYSIDELRVDEAGHWGVALEPDAKAEQWIMLPEDDTVMVRIWNQHYRYSQIADSSVRGVLDLCEQLLFLQNMGLGTAMTRMNNGILLLPSTMLKNRQPADGDGTNGEAQRDPVVQDIMDHILTPIGNPRSAAVAGPLILTGAPEDLEKIRHLTFDRKFDAVADEREVAAIKRLANGVDLPAEVLLGMAELNHWGAWMVDDSTFRSYLQPDANEFVSAVTMGYFQPELLARGFAPDLVRRLCVWYDRSDLVGDPDETDTVFKAVEAGLLGDQPARRRLGFSEAEAPTDDDIARRVALNGSKPDPNADQVTPGTGSGEEPVADANAGPESDAVTAAAARNRRRTLASLSARWTARDRAVMGRTLGQADVAMSRALDRAGAKLRTQAQKNGANLAASLDGIPNREVAAKLGEHVVTASLDVSTEDLLAGAFDEIAHRYRIQLARAQSATLNDLRELGLPEASCDEMATEQEDDRNEAAALLLLGLMGLATVRLFAPAERLPATVALGEVDAHLTVPASLVRYTNAVAGGTPVTGRQGLGLGGGPAGGSTGVGATVDPSTGTTGMGGQPASGATGGSGSMTTGGAILDPVTGEAAGGVASGPTVTKRLQELHISTRAFVWNYGDPAERTNNFEPHVHLDGVEFTAWTAPQLLNFAKWPAFDTYFPGDHEGCLCVAERVLQDDDDTEDRDAA